MNKKFFLASALCVGVGFTPIFAQQVDLQQGSSVSFSGTCSISGEAYIQNSGNTDAGAFKVELWIKQDCFSCLAEYKMMEVTAGSLVAGDQIPLSFSNISYNTIKQDPLYDAATNDYRIFVKIDPDGQVSESSESNNTFDVGSVQCELDATTGVQQTLQEATNFKVITTSSAIQCLFETTQLADFQLQITDITGKMVYSKQIALAQGQQTHDIQTLDFVQGLYFVTLASKGERATKKVAIQH